MFGFGSLGLNSALRLAVPRFWCVMIVFLPGFVVFVLVGFWCWIWFYGRVLDFWCCWLVSLVLLLVAFFACLCSIVPFGLGAGVLGFPGLGAWWMVGSWFLVRFWWLGVWVRSCFAGSFW